MEEYIVYILTFMAVVIPTILYCMSDKSIRVSKSLTSESDLPFMLQVAEPFAGVMDKIGIGELLCRISPAKAADYEKKVVCKIHRRTGGTSGRTEMIVEYHEGSAGKKGRKRTK